MIRCLRVVAVASVLTASLVIAAAPVLAAVPANDTFANATAITALPFDQTLDTRDATTDATDVEANAPCGAPVTLASVWYAFTPSEEAGYVVDVSGSSYEAGVIVVSGSPGALILEACGPFTVSFLGQAGTTYHIMAFSDTAGVNGGQLVIHVEQAPPPPILDVTIDPIGHVIQRTGIATVTGTWTCTGTVDYAEIYGELTQAVGRFAIRGSFGVGAGPCDGEAQAWEALVYPDNGRFGGGKAAAFAYTYACGPFWCSEGYAEQVVKLRR